MERNPDPNSTPLLFPRYHLIVSPVAAGCKEQHLGSKGLREPAARAPSLPGRRGAARQGGCLSLSVTPAACAFPPRPSRFSEAASGSLPADHLPRERPGEKQGRTRGKQPRWPSFIIRRTGRRGRRHFLRSLSQNAPPSTPLRKALFFRSTSWLPLEPVRKGRLERTEERGRAVSGKELLSSQPPPGGSRPQREARRETSSVGS